MLNSVLLMHTRQVHTHKHTHARYFYMDTHTHTHTSYAHTGRQRWGRVGWRVEGRGVGGAGGVAVRKEEKGGWGGGSAQVSQDQNMSAMLVSEL